MPCSLRREIAFAVLWIVLVPAAASPQSAGDWPMYNRDVLGSRHNSDETALTYETVSQLVEKWRFPPLDSERKIGVVHATPVIVEGCVYFGTATDSAFYKLSPDGEICWEYRNPAYGASSGATDGDGEDRFRSTGNGVFGAALVTEDTVYFGDIGGWFYALDLATGAERWKVNARGEGFPDPHPINVFFASPILADGKLIVAGGALEQLIAGTTLYRGSTGRGFVAALDPATGEIVWKYNVGQKPERLDPPVTIEDAWGKHTFAFGPATSSIWSTPSFDAESGTLFFGTDVNTAPRQPSAENPDLHTRESCAIVALDVADGSEKWITQLNSGDVWTNSMRAYDPAMGQYKDQSIGDTPKIYTLSQGGESTKVVGVGCKNGGFYVLRADDGRVIDHTPIYTGPPTYPLSPEPDPRTLALPSPIGGLQTGCATDGKWIYTNGIDALRLGTQERGSGSGSPTTGGRVVAISLDTRSERWRHERPKVESLGEAPPAPVYENVGDPVASGVAVAGGVIYFTTVASGRLVALDAATGEVRKEIEVGPVWSGPSVSRGRVYVGTGNTLFSSDHREAYFPKKHTGVLYSFGLPSEDEVDRLAAGNQ